jgi:hypothetical protein
MERGFYSTGQVARQLGTTPARVRSLCENGVVAAETTPGGQWRVPAHEVERLKRDGLPPIPRPMPVEDNPPEPIANQARRNHSELPTRPSPEVASAEDLVAITRSTLEKRRIERDIEENEDWFRERQRQQEAAAAVERQRDEALLAEQRRRQWMQEWIKYALNSVPISARREVEIEVHTEVEAVLSKLQTCEPNSITRPLVDAAVRRALRPWKRNQEIRSAIDAAVRKLPWEVKNRPEHASLKKRAIHALDEAVLRLRQEASYEDMETATLLAVQPIIREYEQGRECERIVRRVYVFDATSEEQETAKEAVRKALAEVPIGAAQKELEKVEEKALAGLKAAVAQRKEAARQEAQRKAQRESAEWKVDFQLDHIARYLEKEYEFEVGAAELHREAERLRPLIRQALIDESLRKPNMSSTDIRQRIEKLVDEGI